MPFSSFRDRLGSSSKHERDLVVQPVRSATQRSDGAESVLTTTTSSSTSSANTAAIDLLKNQPLTADPVQFVQDAIAPLFNYNPKHDQVTLDDVMEYHVPRYFSPGYRHVFNLIEADIEGKWQACVCSGGRQTVAWRNRSTCQSSVEPRSTMRRS